LEHKGLDLNTQPFPIKSNLASLGMTLLQFLILSKIFLLTSGFCEAEGSFAFACSKTLRCEVETVNVRQRLSSNWHNVVSGRQVLISAQGPRSKSEDIGCGSFCTTLHPRTAIGIDPTRNRVVIAVAEGRRAGVVGVTLSELGNLMYNYGARKAINLDGGGSSSLVLNGVRVNAQSDSEPGNRPVANSLLFLGTEDWANSDHADLE
jgi:exopolysaccharide biosynthesis protein